MADLPRGIRNNDPGNLRKTATPWLGKVAGADPAFESFDTPVDGLRALMVDLLTAYRRHGLDTCQSILNRFAPPFENDTLSYACDVAAVVGVGPQQTLVVSDPRILILLAKAIVRHENGAAWATYPYYWYDDALYTRACQMALGLIAA